MGSVAVESTSNISQPLQAVESIDAKDKSEKNSKQKGLSKTYPSMVSGSMCFLGLRHYSGQRKNSQDNYYLPNNKTQHCWHTNVTCKMKEP